MKRFTLILTLFLMAAMPMMAERVTPETARKVATTFLNNNGAKVAQLTDLSKAAGFPNLYIFNANPGFVVMSADDCVRPILGYSLTNVFVAEGMPENIKGWLQGYSDQIQDAIDNAATADASVRAEWQSLKNGRADKAPSDVVVGPLIETRWNQSSPYNNLCPSSSVTGCVATAMAQVMKYHNFPSHGIGFHSYIPESHPEYGTLSVDYYSTNYDWTHMTNTYGVSSTAEEQLAVATLMYSCGVSVNMDYSPSSSGAVTAFVADALKLYFGYSSDVRHVSRSEYSDSDWIAMLKADLNLNRPIQYHGNGSGGGHSFVCDGYRTDDYFHFNWGWGGYCDDYYVIDNLNPGPGGIGSGSNGIYNNNQGAILGVHPSAFYAAVPTDLTYSQSGRNITLNWDAASGAANYIVYCDNNIVGQPTTNSFAMTTPFGTHKYYVRSVNGSGELSLSSNIVTITIEEVYDLQMTLSGSDASLSWTAPTSCYSETPSATLTYGAGDVYYSWSSVYYGHRYLASNLSAYAGKKVYQVETYIQYPGTYSIYVFNKTKSNKPDPDWLAYSKEGISISYANAEKWNKFDLETPVTISGSDDLWVVFKQEGTGQDYPTPSFNLASHNINAFYAGNSPTNLYDASSSNNCAWFIRAHLTDGTYTYHLYDNGASIADDIATSSYVVSSPANNTAHQYTVKTKYYGGESAASNTAGLTLGEATLASLSLGANDRMTLAENSKLTVTGTLSNDYTANLVIEDGAQLVHNSANVKATMKKSIAAYTANDNGWHFIASPVTENITPSVENGLIANNYDLYYYDEAGHRWRNYRNSSFDLAFKQGYLYANNTNTTLQFAGTLTPSNAAVASNTLSYNSSILILKGFNLIGNPFACNATLSQDFYVIEDHKVKLASVGRQITPCEGVFVKATDAGQTVSFSKVGASKGETANAVLDLVVTQGRSTLDRARVRLGEGINMEKFTLEGDESTQLTFCQEDQDYAVAYANEAIKLPLNFKAAENGTYTLSIETNSLDLGYLHLIDKRTDSDIDLLAMPSYTFEAKTSDNASRFTLVFDESGIASVSAEPFAYVSNGNIIINAATDKATLQMIDVTGRIVVSCTGDAIDHVSTSGMTPGVYVLRLVRGENIKTQKIVIE